MHRHLQVLRAGEKPVQIWRLLWHFWLPLYFWELFWRSFWEHFLSQKLSDRHPFLAVSVSHFQPLS